MKKILKIIGIVLGAVVLLAVTAIGILTAAEYRPDSQQTAERIEIAEGGKPAGKSLTVYTWNIGYGGLGEESDFFMDGGKMVNPPSKEVLNKNLSGITEFISENPADVWFIQEADVNSSRTGGIDEFELLNSTLNTNGAIAYNYKCLFVPFPVPPMGKMETGIATFTSLDTDGNDQRIALPCPFKWPIRTANMKRCLLVTRVPVENSDKELVLINLHLEAYESGEGRIAQTKMLVDIMEAEYAKGNYVIAGGDFNQSFPGALEEYPIYNTEHWVPGELDEADLSEGWRYAADISDATCRLLDAPYNADSQHYVIDGFILSPNVEAVSVETVNMDFKYSDHNPVKLEVTLG